ncbi:MAG: hypothetical protein AB2692_23545 [Candidatus Thiodiazotropha sp.]
MNTLFFKKMVDSCGFWDDCLPFVKEFRSTMDRESILLDRQLSGALFYCLANVRYSFITQKNGALDMRMAEGNGPSGSAGAWMRYPLIFVSGRCS